MQEIKYKLSDDCTFIAIKSDKVIVKKKSIAFEINKDTNAVLRYLKEGRTKDEITSYISSCFVLDNVSKDKLNNLIDCLCQFGIVLKYRI